jgi:DNA transformation protein and related proteins
MPTRATAPHFVDHCIELLAPLGAVRARAMFGGHGLYVDGFFIALIAFERLYLKVDTSSQPQFAAAGCEPFVYAGKRKPVSLGYWTTPPEALDSPALMAPWARLALQSAMAARQRAGVSKPRAAKLKTKPPATRRPSAR